MGIFILGGGGGESNMNYRNTQTDAKINALFVGLMVSGLWITHCFIVPLWLLI